MDSNIEILESQWRQKMEEMKTAITELKLSQSPQISQFGSEFGLRDEDFENETSGDDVWDIISDLGNDDSSDEMLPSSTIYNRVWLSTKCFSIATKNSTVQPDTLSNQIIAILNSDSSDEELQMLLVDLLGFDELDFVAEIITNRDSLKIDGSILTRDKSGVFASLQTRDEREASLRRADIEHKSTPLAPSTYRQEAQYPHVYKAFDAGNKLSAHGKSYALPIGSERIEHDKYEEYAIPATKVGSVAAGQKLVEIKEMDGLCQRTFHKYKSLNRMQSLVYPVAYKTSENMLICAPTGAGKTDAALLAILSTIAKNMVPNPFEDPKAQDFAVNYEEFKIVYVAPMKALAAEVTDKMAKRLDWLGIRVRELTGDMQLTKSEIIETQIIVTTPEKWDVVTRKGAGDTELVQKVRLLIIDEVHMLHDERGAVLESLVARTQRQVESTQSLIRIVGLSATLPNYIDVSDFLHVNRMAGLFYFDASFRPVPLEQHFIGVKGKAGSKQFKENLEIVAFEKVVDMLRLDHQVMIFVHSRKDTLKSAREILQRLQDEGEFDLIDPSLHPGFEMAKRDMKSSKSHELRELIPKGVGTHHAGMPRTDRNLVERLFASGVLKVLCCTATLAWGVNLPAAAVVIKGTELYSADAGKYVDLGILDVLQIFGRAGRPQFQDTGIGFILTPNDKLQHYLNAVTQQQPIESTFSKRMTDNLNAEISLGTVTSVQEGVQWLGYSYLFIRMQKSPLNYGIEWSEIRDDPQLVQRRRKLVIDAARVLQKAQMVIFNETTEDIKPKDVGRIASSYYVQQESIEIFNSLMHPLSTEGDSLNMISMSGEFDQVTSRETEHKELVLLKDKAPAKVKGNGVDNSHAKTNILLQSHISKQRPMDYTLVSDLAYVAQNSARICRALFNIALNRRWGHQCMILLSLCKAIEKQVWPFQHPLHQFDLPITVLKYLDEKLPISSIEKLHDMSTAEIGSLVNNQKAGLLIKNLIKNVPTVSVDAEIAPLNRDVLRVKLFLSPEFTWNDKYHGKSESYWVWVENSDTSEIYHHEYFLLTRRKLYDEHEMHFTIPLLDPLPSQIYVRVLSDRWFGAETVTPVSFQHLIRPDTESVYTKLLRLQPLPVTSLKNPALEEIYSKRFQYFNTMQTQIFHCLYHTPGNVLLGSPTGSGKTVAAELAMWWAFKEHLGSKVVYIAPMKALVKERVMDWGKRLALPLGLNLVELTGDNTPDTKTIRNADIIITTPEKWDGISRSWQTRGYVQQVSLVIIDEIHLLGGDRGPVLEIIVSRMNYIASQKGKSIRLLGMSTACANATDLANWLGVKEGLFNFPHSTRPIPLEIYIDGFAEVRGFCPFMQSMNRPAFLAIKNHAPDKPVIVFVPSRRQTRLTARDLINLCGMEENPRRFVHMSEDDLALNLSRVKDEPLKESLGFGIGLHHAGLVESDRLLSEELFANNKIQILIATSTLAWGVNLPAHLVVVKGTQFYDAKTSGYKDMDLTDVLQMLGRAGRPQFNDSGVAIARIFTQDSKKDFYKHFLHTGFPVESSLHLVLANHIGAEISAGTVTTKQDALDYITWTFFFRRLHKNPSFYGLEISAEEHNSTEAQILANDFITDLVEDSLNELSKSFCIEMEGTGELISTPMGKIMSYYYLSHKTVRMILSKAKPDPSFDDVLAWLSLATEFDELPVRHNEDIINASLAQNLRYKPDKLSLPMWDPHVKSFLLLQTFFDRIPLPITDYVGDQTSVLDQSIRVCQAAIDILAEKGYAKAVKTLITLIQCIKSARWENDSSFAIFPGVDVDRANNVKQAQHDLKWATEASNDQLNVVAQALNANLRTLTTTVRQLPKIQLSANAFTDVVEVNITRTNNLMFKDAKMYAPNFPKKQIEGFFLLASQSDELLALKRVGWNDGKTKITSKLSIPTDLRGKVVDIRLISDGYIGMEWVLEKLKIPEAPAPNVGTHKKE